MNNDKKLHILERESMRLHEENERLKANQNDALIGNADECISKNTELTKQLKETIGEVTQEKNRIAIVGKSYEKKIKKLTRKAKSRTLKYKILGR